MSFRDDSQACRAISALLDRCGLPVLRGLWTVDGPTERAFALLEGCGVLSSGEAVMLQSAFDIWNGQGKASFARILDVLDPERAEALFTLALAVQRGSWAVDRWIARSEAA